MIQHSSWHPPYSNRSTQKHSRMDRFLYIDNRTKVDDRLVPGSISLLRRWNYRNSLRRHVASHSLERIAIGLPQPKQIKFTCVELNLRWYKILLQFVFAWIAVPINITGITTTISIKIVNNILTTIVRIVGVWIVRTHCI